MHGPLAHIRCSSIRVYFWDAAKAATFLWFEERESQSTVFDILWMRGNLMESIKICLAQTHTYLTNTLSVACNFTQVHHSYFSLMPGLTQMQTQLLPAAPTPSAAAKASSVMNDLMGKVKIMWCHAFTICLFRITANNPSVWFLHVLVHISGGLFQGIGIARSSENLTWLCCISVCRVFPRMHLAVVDIPCSDRRCWSQ